MARPAMLVAAAFLLCAAALVLRPSTSQLAFKRLGRPASTRTLALPRTGTQPATRSRAVNPSAALFACAVAVLAPAPLGIVGAPVAFMLIRRLARRLPGPREPGPGPREVAHAADLLAACLEAGCLPAVALVATGSCFPGRLGMQLLAAGRSLERGAPVEEAVPAGGDIAPLAGVLRRSSRSGSSAADQLAALAAQLRSDAHFEALERARRVATLSALPLGLCLLPAFLVLAVVPSVIGLGASVLH